MHCMFLYSLFAVTARIRRKILKCQFWTWVRSIELYPVYLCNRFTRIRAIWNSLQYWLHESDLSKARNQAFFAQTVQTLARFRCLHESGPFSYLVKNLHTLTLYESGQIFERRKTCTDPPFVYTGLVETKTVSQFQEIHLHLAYLASCNEREGLRFKECGIILLIALYLFLNLPVIRNEKETSVDHRFIQRENFFCYLLYDATC